jgi:hypothetical protein
VQPRVFTFDRVLGPLATQDDAYATVAPLVGAALDGFNATVLAYGSTGAGKTHTVLGAADSPGILPRALQALFQGARARASACAFVFRLSYVELYNNSFRDLLAPVSQRRPLPASTVPVAGGGVAEKRDKISLREDESQGVFLTGSASLRTIISSVEEAMALVHRGLSVRAVASTDCNEHSSRSHAILTVDVMSRDSAAAGATTRASKLHIVDLAGSERVGMSGTAGSSLAETQAINLSLTTLGRVLSALAASKGDDRLIPYRDSKLTHLLK